MGKTKLYLLLATFILTPLFSNAQYLDIGILAGAANYQGDLSGPYRAHDPAAYEFSYGLFARYNFNPYVSLRMNVAAINIKGFDIYRRNLSFRNQIIETSLQAEFYIAKFDAKKTQYLSSPYIFAGVAGFYHNPQAELNGEWYDLHPLRTEGQGIEEGKEEYSKTGFSIPMGFGVRFALSEKAQIGAEIGLRYTFTDYLDDISTTYTDLDNLRSAIDSELGAGMGDIAAALSFRQVDINNNPASPPAFLEGRPRGNENQDWYFLGGVTFSYAIGSERKISYKKDKFKKVLDQDDSKKKSSKSSFKKKKKKRKKKKSTKKKKKDTEEVDPTKEKKDVDWDIDGDGDLDEWEDGK